MWIRSQDKMELIDTKRINVESTVIYAFEPVPDGYMKIATYKTKERALEVLSEIQATLLENSAFELGARKKETGELLKHRIVFEMPKE